MVDHIIGSFGIISNPVSLDLKVSNGLKVERPV